MSNNLTNPLREIVWKVTVFNIEDYECHEIEERLRMVLKTRRQENAEHVHLWFWSESLLCMTQVEIKASEGL